MLRGGTSDVKGPTLVALRERPGWLPQGGVERWRQGRADFLEQEISANLHKLSMALRLLRRWAERRGLRPSETAYVSATRHRQPLRFSTTRDPAIEQAYRTHWLSPELRSKDAERVRQRAAKAPDLVVVSPIREWQCDGCGGAGDFLFSGWPWLGRSGGSSWLPATSRRGHRHTGSRSSGRIGRTAAGRALDPEAVTLAVVASVRHEDTPYDELLMAGAARSDARERVQALVDAVLDTWRRQR